jgi:hypothetical protein
VVETGHHAAREIFAAQAERALQLLQIDLRVGPGVAGERALERREELGVERRGSVVRRQACDASSIESAARDY